MTWVADFGDTIRYVRAAHILTADLGGNRSAGSERQLWTRIFDSKVSVLLLTWWANALSRHGLMATHTLGAAEAARLASLVGA